MERIHNIDRRNFIRGLTWGAIAFGLGGCTTAPADTSPNINKNLLSPSEVTGKYPLVVEQTLNRYKLLGLDDDALAQAFRTSDINPDHRIVQRLYETNTDRGRLGISSKFHIIRTADSASFGDQVMAFPPLDFSDVPSLQIATIETTFWLRAFLLYYPMLKDSPGELTSATKKLEKVDVKETFQEVLDRRIKPIFWFGFRT